MGDTSVVTRQKCELADGKKWHVFLCYKSTDEEQAAKLQEAMEKSGFLVMNYVDDFDIGHPAVGQMTAKMEECMRMVVLCTPNFLACEGGVAPLYEAQQGVRQMIDEKERYVILVQNGVDRKNIPKFLRWVPILNSNDPNFERNLHIQLTDASPLEFSLQENVGYGMAYAYFYSYLEIVVRPQPGIEPGTEQPDLKARIRQYKEKPENASVIMPDKIYIIVPESGRLPASVCKEDPRFTDGEKFNVVIFRGGSKRPYWNTIRTLDTGTEKYDVLVEYATALQPLSDMENDQEVHFTQDHRLEQQLVFYTTLDGILRRWPKQYRDMVELVHIDDTKVKIGDEILRRIRLNHKSILTNAD